MSTIKTQILDLSNAPLNVPLGPYIDSLSYTPCPPAIQIVPNCQRFFAEHPAHLT
jgi:hypothetical protein